jgi:acyl-CoA synthetase (AMP-forming)/AMP-acid ligase II
LKVDGATHTSLKYSEFRTHVRNLAKILHKDFNVGPGGDVIICSKNDLYFYVPLYAASALGALVYSIPAYSHGQYTYKAMISKFLLLV